MKQTYVKLETSKAFDRMYYIAHYKKLFIAYASIQRASPATISGKLAVSQGGKMNSLTYRNSAQIFTFHYIVLFTCIRRILLKFSEVKFTLKISCMDVKIN